MTTVDIIDAKGKKSGSAELPADIFDVETNVPLLHQVVTAQLAAARQGTHNTKGRGEVSGSGRKPFKQKGTGRSRQGSIRAPEHRGGGIVHGPTTRSYDQRTPKKMVAKALLGALSDRARGERITITTAFDLDAPSTKAAQDVLTSLNATKRVLIVVDRDEDNAILSLRNIWNVQLLAWDQLNAYDVLVSDDLIFTKTAFDAFVANKNKNAEVNA